MRALTFGPSKDWIFSSSADRTLRLWQVAKSDGEWFVLTIGFPRILGHGFIEVPETGAPTWDAGGNNIVTQSALIDQLHFFTNPDRWLLAHSEWGVWLGNLSWPTRANAIQVDVTAARARLDANPQDARALQTIAAWFALNGSCESALIFFERAQSAGGQPDPFLLGCCYLNAAGQREPSPAEAATREAYDKMVRDWHAHRLELAAKAKLRFDDAAKTSAVSASQGQVAAVYAAISAAIQQEEQQPTAQ